MVYKLWNKAAVLSAYKTRSNRVIKIALLGIPLYFLLFNIL